MQDLLNGLPGWLLFLLGGGYIIRLEIKNKNGNGSPTKRELRDLITEMRVFVQHMRTWTALHEERARRMEGCLDDIRDRMTSGSKR